MKKVIFYFSILILICAVSSCKEQKDTETTTTVVDTLNVDRAEVKCCH